MPRAKSKKTGLKKWFAEEWIDVKTGKKCGRSCLLYTSDAADE